jgi:Transcriptional regulator
MASTADDVENGNGAGKANAIEKALQLLMEFTPNNSPMSTSELSRSTGFHTATTSRILITLAEHGFLRQDPSTRRFSLGESIVKLSRAVDRSLKSGLVALAKPYLDELSVAVSQTVTLETMVGTNTILGCVVEGPQIVRVAGQIGEVMPWNIAAGLRSILAFLSPEERQKFLVNPMETFTKKTINTIEDYLAALEVVRRKGYSFEEGEFFVGINAIGAPIFDRDQRPIAAVCVVGMSDEVNDSKKDIIKELKKTTAKLSAVFFSPGK